MIELAALTELRVHKGGPAARKLTIQLPPALVAERQAAFVAQIDRIIEENRDALDYLADR